MDKLLKDAEQKIVELKKTFKMQATDKRLATPDYAKFGELYEGILLAERLVGALKKHQPIFDKSNTDHLEIKAVVIEKINHELNKRGEIDVSKIASIAFDAVVDTLKGDE